MFTNEAEVLLSKKRALQGRRLVVVDLENVVGGAVMRVEQAVDARLCISKAIGLAPDGQVVIGTSHTGLLSSGLGWPTARLVVRSGENGADLALLEVLQEERIADRFDEVALVSGDGIFADVVAALGRSGVAVTAVSRPEACSRRLRMAAARSIALDSADLLGGAA